MALELNGTTGVSLVQDGVITDANLPTGSVLQVPTQALTYTQFTTTSTSFADWTGMSVTITPSSTSSRILIFVHCNGIFSGTSGNNPLLRILRDSTVVGVPTDYAAFDASNGNNGGGTVSLVLEDSPNTTSAVTYKIQYRSDNGGLVYFNVNDSGSAQLGDESTNSTLTLMEIAG